MTSKHGRFKKKLTCFDCHYRLVQTCQNCIIISILSFISNIESITFRGFKSGLPSPDIPDEALIKRATQLSVSEIMKLHLIQT